MTAVGKGRATGRDGIPCVRACCDMERKAGCRVALSVPERTEEGLLARLKRAGLSFVPGAAGKYRFCTVTRQACGTAEPLIK